MSDHVSEVLGVTSRFGEPFVIVGHSSGAIVALEALAADPSPFAGAVLRTGHGANQASPRQLGDLICDLTELLEIGPTRP